MPDTENQSGVLDAQTDNPSGISDGLAEDYSAVQEGSADTGEEHGTSGGGNTESGDELSDSDAGNGVHEESGEPGSDDGETGSESSLPDVIYEQPPTTPAEPVVTTPEPEPEPSPENEPIQKTAEELLAEIAEDERRLGIIDRNIAAQRLELARKKNQLAALYCPIKPGDSVRLERSRFKMAHVLAIIAPAGTQHKNGVKSFSMTTQGIKQDGTLSDVVWTSHDYQLLEKIVFKDPDPIPPLEPPVETPVDPVIAKLFDGLIAIASPAA